MYELANEFGCHRATAAKRLKKAGIAMRLQSPTIEDIDSMANLIASGLSLQAVGEKLGFCANTVRNCLESAHSFRTTKEVASYPLVAGESAKVHVHD